MKRSVEGIVLRGTDYGETHRVVTLLTAEFGKIGAMARGANRPQSRLRALVRPPVRARFLLSYTGRGMGILSQGELIDGYRAIREDLWKYAYSGYALELVDRFTEEAVPSSGLFHFVAHWLEQLAAGKDPEVLTVLLELRVCHWAGVRPVLDRCAGCGEALSESPVFDIAGGGPLCRRCARERPGVAIGSRVPSLLRLLQEVPVDRIGDIRVRPETKRQMSDLLAAYLEHHTGVRLRGREYIRKLEQYGRPT